MVAWSALLLCWQQALAACASLSLQAASSGTCVTAVALTLLPPCTCDAGGNQRDKAGAVAIRQPYLRVIGFQEDVLNGDTARRPTFR